MPRRISQGRELSRSLTGAPHDAQLFTQSRTLRTTQLLGLNSSTGWFDLAAPDRIVARADFHRLSRAGGPRQQLRKSSSAASQKARSGTLSCRPPELRRMFVASPRNRWHTRDSCLGDQEVWDLGLRIEENSGRRTGRADGLLAGPMAG